MKQNKNLFYAILLLVSLAFTKMGIAQNSCTLPSTVIVDAAPSNKSQTANKYWYSFTATGDDLFIDIVAADSTFYGIDSVIVYEGSCGSLTPVKIITKSITDTVGMMELYLIGLPVSNNYFVKVSKQSYSTVNYALSVLKTAADACNLTNNPSFNNYGFNACPVTQGTVGVTGAALSSGWFANGGTPDFYHSCNTTTSSSNPNYLPNGLIPVSPGGYYGLHCGSVGNQNIEYMSGSMVAMVANKKYYVYMQYAKTPRAQFTMNRLGMSLSAGMPISTNSGIGFSPAQPWQIRNPGNAQLTNTVFVTMGSCYQATGGENFITIGNYAGLSGTNYAPATSTGTVPIATTDYLIDNVVAVPLDLNISPPVTICLGSTATLTTSLKCPLPLGVITNTAGVITNSLFVWTPTVSLSATTGTTTVASPTATTIYTITLTIPPINSNGSACTITNTVQVTVAPNPTINISATPSKTICEGNSVTLTATGADTYTWSPGATVSSSIVITPTANITYTATGTNTITGCIDTETIAITVIPNVTLTASASPTAVCSGFSSTLTAGGATTYTWMPGGATTASTVVSPTATTIYTVTGKTGACSNTKTVSVTVKPTPTVTVNSATICSGTSTVLTANGATTYSWNTGATTNTISVSPTSTTNYTVTGTTNGCVNTKTATVTVAPTPTISVASKTICAGSCATLTASGANTYTWSAPITSTVNPAVVCPTVTTIYTVTGKNNGCTTTSVKTATVTVVQPLPGSFLINPSVASPVVANGTGTNVIGLTTTGITNTVGLTFNWQPSGATTPTTAFNLTQPEIISLTVYNNTCGTSITQSICVNYVSASCSGTFATLNNATLTGTATLGATTATYNVTGTLTINWGMPTHALENKTFIMATGSKVEISPTTRIILNNIKFYSCNNMWQGIEIKTSAVSNASVTISGDQNSIEDAYMGIYCINPAGANLNPIINCVNGVLFNKNYHDVYLENTKNATIPYPATFSKVRMLSESSNNSPGGNLKCSSYYTPTAKARSYAGLYAKDAGIVTFSVLANPTDYNVVKNKDYGLYFNNTNSTVNNVSFCDAIGVANSYTQSFGPLPSGVGIYSKNSGYLNVKPTTPPSPFAATTTFTNLGYSIITNNTYTVDVQNTNHTSSIQSFTVDPVFLSKPAWGSTNGVAGTGLNGIFVTNARDICRINNNTFSQNYYPITVNYTTTPLASVIMSIAQNTISATGTGVVTEGTTINSTLPFFGANTDNMRVAANTYTNVQLGVKATAIKSGLRISNNIITLKSTGSHAISLSGSNNAIVDANQIIGNNSATIVNIGIFCHNSPACKIKCNTISNTGHGIEYRGGNASPGDGFFGNTLNYPMRRGLVLSNGGIIGTQGNSSGASANVWNGFVNINNVDQTLVGGNPPGGALSDAANSQLYVHNTATELPTDNGFLAPSIIGNRYLLTVNMFTTTAGNTSTCPSSLTPQALRTNGTTSLDNTDRDNDFVNYINNLVPATNDDLTPQDKFLLKQYMFEALSQNPSTNSTLANFYNQQQTSSINTYYDIDSLLAAGNMALATIKNNQASQTNDITQTQNAYNALYINGINNQTDLDNLIAIADLCPSLYGNAVFEARALVQSITYVGKVYNDSCDNSKAKKGEWIDGEDKSISVAQGVQAKLYPNPNNGAFTLAYDLKKNNVATITITDITGKLVYKGILDNLDNRVQINTSNLNNGIYFIQITHDKTLLWTDKLMINK